MRASTCHHNLRKLARLYGTDKGQDHSYAHHYQKTFHHLKQKKLNILEIGVGGYSDPNIGGASLRMWKAYFRKSNIYGIDYYNKKPLEENRIRIFQGDQNNAVFLQHVTKEIGNLDIIIDDGSHINEHVIKTFEILFPLMNKEGIYVIEDTQTSYWPGFGGDSYNLNHT